MAAPLAPRRQISQREVTASKAGIYTNIYSGPTATLEFSMLAERLETMSGAVDEANKALKALRGDVDTLKSRTRGLAGGGGDGVAPIGFLDGHVGGIVGESFESDDPENTIRLADVRCAPLPTISLGHSSKNAHHLPEPVL